MNPEERRQLLEERTTRVVRAAPDPEEARERREQRMREDAAVIEAFRQRPQSVGDVLRSNIALCRKIIDPRVLLEAADVGLGEAELEQMRERMGRWVEAVLEKIDGETHERRRNRLRELMDRMFQPRRIVGCECAGTGWIFGIGDMRLSNGKVKSGVEHYRTCGCARGKAKQVEVEKMGWQKSVRGRGKKDSDEVVPF